MADEVRKLAERTQNSLSEINNTINLVVQSVGDVSGEIDSSSKDMQEASELSKTLQEIVSTNTELVRSSIAANIQNVNDYKQIEQSVNQAMEQIKEIDQIANTNARSMEEVGSASDNLAKMTALLDEELGTFKL